MEYSGLDHKVKHDVTIALIGNSRVGKTALVQRLAQVSRYFLFSKYHYTLVKPAPFCFHKNIKCLVLYHIS